MTKKVTEIKDMEGLVNRMLVVSADSTVYKKIAAYIEQYYMQIIFMTAGELALQLSVSQGSVSKFCIALGYRGYADFLRNLQKFVGKEITAPERYHYIFREHAPYR
ncbi:MAG: MurR/RpiR family transcriptional regulator [Roseburia sp.]